MTELQQKQLAFLEETATYYNSNNRGIGPNGCSYEAGCAIGRKIADKELCKELDAAINDSSVGSTEVFPNLPKELQELGKGFLTAVQSLHDSRDNWCPEGLSDYGKKQFYSIKQAILNNSYK